MMGTDGGSGGTVGQETVGDVLVLTLAHPPAARLTAPMRAALMAALRGTAQRAVVLRGSGRGFATGTSLDGAMEGAAEETTDSRPAGGSGNRPDNGHTQAPTLADLCRAIENSPRPVVAALHGAVIGAGAELALAAQARVASEDTRFSLPEAGLGLVPQAGASLRLPRLVGAAEALRLLSTGRVIMATDALVIGLLDHVVEGDPLAAALLLASRHQPGGTLPGRRDGLRDVAGYLRAVAQGRAAAARSPLPVMAALVDCVEAALLLPDAQGLVVEATLRRELLRSPEAAGLRSAALAERSAATVPAAIAAAQPRLVGHLGVLGGSGSAAAVVVAQVALARGLSVTWADADRARLAAALQALAQRQEAEITAGRLTPAARDADWARLVSAGALAALAEAGIILLAGQETPAATEAALAALARAVPGVPVLVMGGAAGAAAGGMGLAVSPSARLSELALPEAVSPVVAATAVQVLRRIGLPPVLLGHRVGLGSAVLAAGRAAVLALCRSGVSAEATAAALSRFGMPLPEAVLRDLRAVPPAKDVAGVDLAPADILNRWLAALANAGLRQLADGVARRPSDIDHLLVAGHGFPRHRGGPMHLAEARGLLVLRADLRRWAALDPVWQPAALLDRLILDGRKLAALNGR